jgi:fatty acyl-CoA reductase
MVRVQNKLDKAATCLHYFATREWKFLGENTLALNATLSAEDKAVFPFDVRQINWPAYIEAYVLGIRQFIFKEPPSSLPTARKQLRK